MAAKRKSARRAKTTSTTTPRKRRKVSAPGLTQQRLLEAVSARPGLHGREYAVALKLSKGAVSAASKRLEAEGLIRKTGHTQSTRLFPAGRALRAANAAATATPAPVETPSPTRVSANGATSNGDGAVNVALLKALGVEPVSATLLGDVLVVNGDVYRIEKERIGASIKG